jgi:hypothetical protein
MYSPTRSAAPYFAGPHESSALSFNDVSEYRPTARSQSMSHRPTTAFKPVNT